MSTFRLDALSPMLLEKIITKVEKRSYFRLQQTSRWVGELIQRSRHISVPVDSTLSLKFNGPSWEFYSFFGAVRTRKRRALIGEEIVPFVKKLPTAESLYGTRVAVLQPRERLGEFESLCAFLKKYHITCEKLYMSGIAWTTEQCAALVRILRPAEVEMKTGKCGRFKCFFHARHLKSIKVYLHWEDVSSQVGRLLSTAAEVTLIMMDKWRTLEDFSKDYQLEFFRMIYETFRSTPLPKLHTLMVHMQGRRLLSRDEITKELDKIAPEGNTKTARNYAPLFPTTKYDLLLSDRSYTYAEIVYIHPRQFHSDK